jgi:hypothetical protein
MYISWNENNGLGLCLYLNKIWQHCYGKMNIQLWSDIQPISTNRIIITIGNPVIRDTPLESHYSV